MRGDAAPLFFTSSSRRTPSSTPSKPRIAVLEHFLARLERMQLRRQARGALLERGRPRLRRGESARLRSSSSLCSACRALRSSRCSARRTLSSAAARGDRGRMILLLRERAAPLLGEVPERGLHLEGLPFLSLESIAERGLLAQQRRHPVARRAQLGLERLLLGAHVEQLARVLLVLGALLGQRRAEVECSASLASTDWRIDCSRSAASVVACSSSRCARRDR
jgi:hypothetical protein